MNRLRVQLTLAFTLVVLVAVGAIAVLFIRTTNAQFRRYITDSGMQASGSGMQQLVAYYQQQGSWDGVESLLEQDVFVIGPWGVAVPGSAPPSRRPGGQLALTLADEDGRIVYDSAAESQGRKLSSREKSQALPITESDGGEPIGFLLLSFQEDLDRLGGLEQQFLDRMEQVLITGAVLAVLVGLVIGALLSRNLTAPLQHLATAARAVGTGDLDQQVRVEGSAEMVKVAQAFNEMTTALRASERQRQNMVADVAHELRTPLSVLQGNLRAILDDVYPLEKPEISRLYDESRLLGRLVDDLRELALADAGQLRLNLRPMNVVEAIQSTAENLAPAAIAQGVLLTCQPSDGLPPVKADPDRVAQILRNLLVNALRHTPSGGSVTVTAAVTGHRPSGTTAPAVEIAVADTGDGIAPADLPHVFERFWRADPARARTGSTGLGLSIAQSLVEAQGGCIWVESAPGAGTVFRFTLPQG
jgi:signal transduction histidine kinase